VSLLLPEGVTARTGIAALTLFTMFVSTGSKDSSKRRCTLSKLLPQLGDCLFLSDRLGDCLPRVDRLGGGVALAFLNRLYERSLLILLSEAPELDRLDRPPKLDCLSGVLMV
jgi:hypothetical protein